MGQLEDIVKELHNGILDIVGDEFAPKQESGSPERRRLLGLITQTGPLIFDTEIRIRNLFLDLIEKSRKSGTPLHSLTKWTKEL